MWIIVNMFGSYKNYLIAREYKEFSQTDITHDISWDKFHNFTSITFNFTIFKEKPLLLYSLSIYANRLNPELLINVLCYLENDLRCWATKNQIFPFTKNICYFHDETCCMFIQLITDSQLNSNWNKITLMNLTVFTLNNFCFCN